MPLWFRVSGDFTVFEMDWSVLFTRVLLVCVAILEVS